MRRGRPPGTKNKTSKSSKSNGRPAAKVDHDGEVKVRKSPAGRKPAPAYRQKTRGSAPSLLSSADPVAYERALKNQLRDLGLYAANTVGDGNCLFRALSDQVYGFPGQHVRIREEVCNHMADNKDKYAAFVSEDRTLSEHVKTMRVLGTYGGHLELSAFARHYNRTIKVVQPGLVYVVSCVDEDAPAASLPPEPSPIGVSEAADDIADEDWPGTYYVAYHNWEHYSSIRNLAGPHSGQPRVQEKPVEGIYSPLYEHAATSASAANPSDSTSESSDSTTSVFSDGGNSPVLSETPTGGEFRSISQSHPHLMPPRDRSGSASSFRGSPKRSTPPDDDEHSNHSEGKSSRRRLSDSSGPYEKIMLRLRKRDNNGHVVTTPTSQSPSVRSQANLIAVPETIQPIPISKGHTTSPLLSGGPLNPRELSISPNRTISVSPDIQHHTTNKAKGKIKLDSHPESKSPKPSLVVGQTTGNLRELRI